MTHDNEDLYGVVRYTTTPFDDNPIWGSDEVYGVLVGETSIRAFQVQRPIINYHIEIVNEIVYFEKYSHIDLGSKSDDSVCDDIIIFQHEDIEIQEYMDRVLHEYRTAIDNAMKITTRFLEFDKPTYALIIQGLYDGNLATIKTSVNLVNFKPLPHVEEYMTRNLHYDATWRHRYW